MGEVGDRTQGSRRMAARNKPAGIRSLVYGMGKSKVRIEGLSVSGPSQRASLVFNFTFNSQKDKLDTLTRSIYAI
jgi:hypothetical protein